VISLYSSPLDVQPSISYQLVVLMGSAVMRSRLFYGAIVRCISTEMLFVRLDRRNQLLLSLLVPLFRHMMVSKVWLSELPVHGTLMIISLTYFFFMRGNIYATICA
jgi:hypothetical protein